MSISDRELGNVCARLLGQIAPNVPESCRDYLRVEFSRGYAEKPITFRAVLNDTSFYSRGELGEHLLTPGAVDVFVDRFCTHELSVRLAHSVWAHEASFALNRYVTEGVIESDGSSYTLAMESLSQNQVERVIEALSKEEEGKKEESEARIEVSRYIREDVI